MAVLRPLVCVAVLAASAFFAAGSRIETPADPCIQVRSLGSPCDHVNATTLDGFVLDILHIPSAPGAHGNPVVLQHGLIDSAATYVANAAPEHNLATILSREGFDVYMPNSRGNHYSLTNHRYPERNASFWRMTDWDEMAAFDVPAVVSAVLGHNANTTASGATKLSWVGHSQGTTMMFAALSTSARYIADKINLFVALAPVAYVYHTTSSLLKLAVDLKVAEDLEAKGVLDVLENDGSIHDLTALCGALGDDCAKALAPIVGTGNLSNFDPKMFASVTRFTPGGTGTSNLLHWAQLVRNNTFAMHDFGPKLNEEYYHQATAPVYNLSAFPASVPVALFSGGADALSDPVDVARLAAELPAVSWQTQIANYAHMDFVWGLDAHTVLYPRVCSLLKAALGL